LHDTETEKASRPEVRSITRPAAPIVQPLLFSSVLLEVDGMEKRRRRWTAISSVAFQSLILGTLLIIPLMFTEALPKQQLLTFLVAPPPPPPPPAAAVPAQVVHRIESNLMDDRLRTPGRIPQKVQMIREEEAPPPMNSGGGVVGGVPGGIPGGQLGGVIGGIISATSSTAAVPKLATPPRPERVRISQGVTQGRLLLKVEPKYSPIARGARIQGQVVLSAIISKTGEIEDLTLVSGHPMLVPGAIEAVKQWRYRPYLLNGGPVEVETTITVTFLLL
jgi:periplasmic protein TonB